MKQNAAETVTEPDLSVNLAGVSLQNPVMTCSGTFASGEEYGEFIDVNKLGAIVTKGVSSVPWEGNDTPRIAETPAGMLNAVGLQNPGVEKFCERDLPKLAGKRCKVIVNVCGHSVEEYAAVAERLSHEPVDLLEINISCPNVKEGGIGFGTDPSMTEKVTREMKRVSKKPIIMKLTPNVTSIAEIARAAEAGGADAVSLINTLTGMKIDIERQGFLLANGTGGLSGPAIHPVAVRMVYEASRAVKIPVIGMGGIASWEDAVEMLLAGASAVGIGTAHFYNPTVDVSVIEGLASYMKRKGIATVKELIGAVHISNG